MFPYWLLFAVFAFGAVVSTPDFRFGKRIGSLWIGAVVLTLFIGLRFETGVDWFNYLLSWNAAGRMSLPALLQDRGGDPGFYALLWLLRNLGLQYWSLNLICAAIFTTGLVCFARRLPNPWLATFIGVPYLAIVIAMSGIRQATAIGFVFLGLLAFFDRKPRAFLGWSALAAVFHASAILTLPLAGLSFAKNKLQSAVLILAAAAVAYLALVARMDLYADRYGGVGVLLQSAGTPYRIAMTVAAAWAYLVFVSPNVAIEEHERTLWKNYSIVAFVAIPLLWLVPSTTALDRTLLYFYSLQIFSLGMLPYTNIRATPGIVIAAIITYFGIAMYVFFAYAENAESYIPYQFWFNP